MTISQPIATDKQNNPDHSLMHRQIATDPAAPVQSLTIDADGKTAFYVPYMMQSDLTTQAIANINNTQVITFNTSDHIDGITRTSSSRFTFPIEGSYLIAFSGIASGATGKILEVWIKVDGNDVANSNTRYVFKSTGATAVIAVTFIYHFDIGQYLEFWTWGDSVSNAWTAYAAGTNPTRPATPSIIMTCNYVGKD